MERDRIHFIDALRGYAILMMLQGHTVGVVLAEQWRSSDYIGYTVWNYMRGITAPAFFFASGLILAYIFFSGPEGKLRERGRKTGRRGIWLMLLGSLTLVYPSTIVSLFQGAWGDIRFYKVSSVLHLIGLALCMTAGLLWLSRRNAKMFTIMAGCLAAGLFLGAPWLRSIHTGVGLIDFFNQQRAGSIFILSPWLGHYFVGCVLGYWAAHREWYRRTWVLCLFIPVGLFISREAFWYLERLLVVLGVLEFENEMFRQGFDQVYRLGEVVVLTGVIGLLAHFGWVPRWLRLTGRETLSIYMLHSAVVYSAFFGVGYSTLWRRELGPWSTLCLAGFTMVIFVVLAHYLPRLRERVPLLGWIR